MHTGFFLRLPQRHGQQVGLPVSVPARPAPRVIEVVPHQQHPVARGIDQKARADEVKTGGIPCEQPVAVLFDEGQHDALVAVLLLAAGGKRGDLLGVGHGGLLFTYYKKELSS